MRDQKVMRAGINTRNLFCLALWTWFFFKTPPLFVHKNSWKTACRSPLRDIISWQWTKHFWFFDSTTLLKYWVHSISLFKMILLAAHFIVKTCLSDTKAQILEWWMKGWFPYPVKPSFFCSCLCFKRVCKWGKTFKG